MQRQSIISLLRSLPILAPSPLFQRLHGGLPALTNVESVFGLPSQTPGGPEACKYAIQLTQKCGSEDQCPPCRRETAGEGDLVYLTSLHVHSLPANWPRMFARHPPLVMQPLAPHPPPPPPFGGFKGVNSSSSNSSISRSRHIPHFIALTAGKCTAYIGPAPLLLPPSLCFPLVSLAGSSSSSSRSFSSSILFSCSSSAAIRATKSR
jgi:hypothetical protein